MHKKYKFSVIQGNNNNHSNKNKITNQVIRIVFLKISIVKSLISQHSIILLYVRYTER